MTITPCPSCFGTGYKTANDFVRSESDDPTCPDCLTNWQRVATLLDPEAATLLQSHGLIRHDGWHAPKPEVWKLHVCLGAAVPHFVGGLRREFEDIVATYVNSHPPKTSKVYWRYGRHDRTHFEALYYREASAKAQLTLATKAGLDATLTPCIVIPVKDFG